ncbi:MAG: hypothetical protein M3R62_04170, partial [Acidobacteriota bacterium]|nr:hypothetical protein [Acidobacteriota bacterium]
MKIANCERKGRRMKMSPLPRKVLGAGIPVAVLALAVVLTSSPRARAEDDDDREGNDSRIQQGFSIAPVPLNLRGKNRALVGLGSYLVNAVGGCNDCHTQPPYAPGGNPFMGQHKIINAAHYLGGGGTPFGPFFIPRNLTPDKTGRPEGGNTFSQFRQIMTTGIDPDHAHPQFGPY